MKKDFTSEEYWSESWTRHIETYLASPPRAGFWISKKFSNKLSMLEIAGGSCRDSRYLSSIGINIVGTDFDHKTIKYLEERFSKLTFKVRQEDAFSLSLSDKSIDLSFSNGFWVLFPNNREIQNLLYEQVRVTRKYIVSFVHNIENQKLVESFKKKSKSDSLYDIRFFHRDELYDLVKATGIESKSIKIKKFGGPMDKFFEKNLKGIKNPLEIFSNSIVPNLYEYQSWSRTERIACIIELF